MTKAQVLDELIDMLHASWTRGYDLGLKHGRSGSFAIVTPEDVAGDGLNERMLRLAGVIGGESQ